MDRVLEWPGEYRAESPAQRQYSGSVQCYAPGVSEASI